MLKLNTNLADLPVLFCCHGNAKSAGAKMLIICITCCAAPKKHSPNSENCRFEIDNLVDYIDRLNNNRVQKKGQSNMLINEYIHP